MYALHSDGLHPVHCLGLDLRHAQVSPQLRQKPGEMARQSSRTWTAWTKENLGKRTERAADVSNATRQQLQLVSANEAKKNLTRHGEDMGSSL